MFMGIKAINKSLFPFPFPSSTSDAFVGGHIHPFLSISLNIRSFFRFLLRRYCSLALLYAVQFMARLVEVLLLHRDTQPLGWRHVVVDDDGDDDDTNAISGSFTLSFVLSNESNAVCWDFFFRPLVDWLFVSLPHHHHHCRSWLIANDSVCIIMH